MKANKISLLEKLRERIKSVQKSIAESVLHTKELAGKSIGEIKTLNKEDQVVYFELQYYAERRLEELSHLNSSPFFIRCDLTHEKKGEQKTYYFAKHQLTEESIYSWVAPLSSVRFENPGPITYTLPNGVVEKAFLSRKEQYMIVDGKVLFFAIEQEGSPRDLIYQEHFLSRGTGFVLPEIVAVMEKAQDQIIRAHHSGSFVIAGPAGSGKTTLALHRVAYLVQAPDTTADYPTESIIVFVQDTGTKDYFSNLLPELGIKGVTIATFAEWAMEILDINKEAGLFVQRPGSTEKERDLYEHHKITALRNSKHEPYRKKHHVLLEKVYKSYLKGESVALFENQKKEKTFDKIDLTILLKAYFAKYPKIEKVKEYFSPNKKGELKKRKRRLPIEYSLIVVDEFQNSLPEQLLFYKQTLRKDNKSIVYVGDMAQQVQFGTLKDWSEIGEEINSERKVMLEKVYRNTKQILYFIESLGYKVSIPKGIKEGPHVVEKTCATFEDESVHIQSLVKDRSNIRIGILAKEELLVEKYKTLFKAEAHIHVLTMAQAQGVEFDLVVLAGINSEMFSGFKVLPETIQVEKRRIDKDLLYVALTRAIKELHIIGQCKLNKAVREIMS